MYNLKAAKKKWAEIREGVLAAALKFPHLVGICLSLGFRIFKVAVAMFNFQ